MSCAAHLAMCSAVARKPTTTSKAKLHPWTHDCELCTYLTRTTAKAPLAGTLFLDCVPLGNSSAPSCFTDDDLAGQPAACAPAAADSAAPLQTVLTTPVGTDGLAGSLCQLQVSSTSVVVARASGQVCCLVQRL